MSDTSTGILSNPKSAKKLRLQLMRIGKLNFIFRKTIIYNLHWNKHLIVRGETSNQQIYETVHIQI